MASARRGCGEAEKEKNGWRKRVSPTGGVHLSVIGERGRAGGLLAAKQAGREERLGCWGELREEAKRFGVCLFF
jgi:hypothetical protein